MNSTQIQAQIDLVNAQIAAQAAQAVVQQKQNAVQTVTFSARLAKLQTQLEAAIAAENPPQS